MDKYEQMYDDKYKRLVKVSDPKEVDRRADEFYNKSVFLSTRKYKKYMILDNNDKWRHFGSLLYEDFTRHKNNDRREKYIKRMKGIKGNWRDDIYSPNMLSLVLLWNETLS
jgi:hypothetical protein